MAHQSFEEDLLRRWFPHNAEETLTPFTENDIREIADVLTRCGRERWSRVPRLYSVLRKIDQQATIDAFIDSDITDVYFPFNKSTLPEALRDHSARLRFLELQHLVYNREALSLERHAPHGHFSDSTEVPFKKVGELGKGGFGYVDRVVSTISHKEYARKLILRGRTFKKDKQVLKDFTKELWNLKKLSHKHLVELVGSYTDKRFVAIVMLPVADANLQTFLEKTDFDENSRSFLRPFFGCLTSALCYLHDNRIRHKDIKPSNVLIKGDQVYFTDFGTALDWSSKGSSVTATAPPTTPRYCAPEVMAYTERNSSSDIWSFGCVFLEMWTVLKSRTLEDLETHMTAHGSGVRAYHSNLKAVTMWIEILRRSSGPSSDYIPSNWIVNMLQDKPTDRWNIHTLDNHILEACVDSSVQHMFKGVCCLELEDDLSDDMSSLAEDSEDCSAIQLQTPHTDDSTGTKSLPVGLKLDQSVSIVKSEHDEETVFLGEVERPVDSESKRLLHSVISSRAQERDKSLEDVSEDTSRPTVTDTKNSVTSILVPLHSGVATEDDDCPETRTSHDIAQPSSSNSDVEAISHYPNRSSPSFCHWHVALEIESDSETDDDLSDLNKINSAEDEAASRFQRHARVCASCKDPLEVFRRHAELCVEGLYKAKQVLEILYRSDGRVYGVDVTSTKTRGPVARTRPVHLPVSLDQVASLLKAIQLSKRCSGNYMFLARYCDDPGHRYWQELYPCYQCKSPLGTHIKSLKEDGELVHEVCNRRLGRLYGEGNLKEDDRQLQVSRLLPSNATSERSQRSSRGRLYGEGNPKDDDKQHNVLTLSPSDATSERSQRSARDRYTEDDPGDHPRRKQEFRRSTSKTSGVRSFMEGFMEGLLTHNKPQAASSKQRKSKGKDGKPRPTTNSKIEKQPMYVARPGTEIRSKVELGNEEGRGKSPNPRQETLGYSEYRREEPADESARREKHRTVTSEEDSGSKRTGRLYGVTHGEDSRTRPRVSRDTMTYSSESIKPDIPAARKMTKSEEDELRRRYRSRSHVYVYADSDCSSSR